jgi:hypothetical protein
LLSTTFQKLAALMFPLPAKSTCEPAPDAAPPPARPLTNVLVGSLQLSSTEPQLVPDVGAVAVANTPCARLSDPNDVEM